MRFSWDEQNIEWFLNAAAYTDFHRKLADIIKSALKPGDSVCDVGCGLGRLDLELAAHVASVTALDINPLVLAQLTRDVEACGIKNLRIRNADAEKLTEKFDVILMSFFMNTIKEIDTYLACCKKLIRVVNIENHGYFHPGQQIKNRDTAQIAGKELADAGIRFELQTAALEFGQPLRSWQEAVQFVRFHEAGISEQQIDTFLNEHAIETAREDYPLYLPNLKKIGIFYIYGTLSN